MGAKDYTFCAGWYNIFLARKTKRSKDGMHIMSNDRRPLEENEILYIFEHYFRRWCEENENDTLSVTDSDGKVIFEVTLKDKD